MTEKSTHTMGPNVRRFVRSAWLLLIAQLLAACFALGATGWAAFYVADLRAERDQLRQQVEQLSTAEAAAAPAYEASDEDIVEPVEETEPPAEDPLPPAPRTETTPPPAPTVTRAPRPAPPVTRRPTPAAPPAQSQPRPAPQPPTAERPTEPPRETRRPNRTYPGGLPGDQGSNAEPPFIPGRYYPDRPTNRPPAIPDVDLDGLVPPPNRDDPVQRSPDATDRILRRDDDRVIRIVD